MPGTGKLVHLNVEDRTGVRHACGRLLEHMDKGQLRAVAILAEFDGNEGEKPTMSIFWNGDDSACNLMADLLKGDLLAGYPTLSSKNFDPLKKDGE